MSKSKSSLAVVMALLAGGVLTACATIVDGGETKPVTITSQPSGKRFTITDASGKVVQAGVTPSIVTLKRSDGTYFGRTKYKVTLEDSGSSQDIRSEITGWYIAGNLMFGGLIGYLIVDPMSGAMYTLKPEEVSLR